MEITGNRALTGLVEAESFERGVVTSVQALSGAFLTPNVVFLTVPEEISQDGQLTAIMETAHDHDVGVVLSVAHPRVGWGRRREVVLVPAQDVLVATSGMRLWAAAPHSARAD